MKNIHRNWTQGIVVKRAGPWRSGNRATFVIARLLDRLHSRPHTQRERESTNGITK